MSIAAVAHRFVFGMNLEANTEQVQRDMVHFVDDKTLVFPAGSNVVVFDRERNSQRFIPMSEKGEAITALAVSKDRRWLAVAERSTKPTVIIYDMNIYRKRKTLVLADDNLQATVGGVVVLLDLRIKLTGEYPLGWIYQILSDAHPRTQLLT